MDFKAIMVTVISVALHELVSKPNDLLRKALSKEPN